MKKYFYFLLLFAFSHAGAQTPELLVQLGHSDGVRSFDYNRDGSYIISGGYDNVIKLWQVGSGLMVRTFSGHHGLVYDVKWSADGRSIYSCSWDDKRLIKWDISNGKIIKEYIFRKYAAIKISVSNDGKYIAAACGDEGVMLFNASDLTFLKKFDIKEAAFVDFSRDNKTLYVIQKEYSDPKVLAFDLATGKKSKELKLFSNIDGAAIEGNRMVVCNYEKVSFYDLAALKEIFTVEKNIGRIRSVTLSRNAKLIAYGNEFGDIKLINEKGMAVKDADGNEIKLAHAHKYQANYLQFSPSGEFLSSASGDRTLKVFSTSTGQVARDLKTHSESVMGISLNATGNLLAFSSTNMSVGNHIGVWDLMKGKLVSVHKGKDANLPFASVAFNQKGKGIAAAGMDGTMNYWDFPGRNSGNLSIGGSPATCVTYTPNGKNIISGTKDGKLVIWRPDRDRSEKIESDKSGIASVAVSPDGTLIAAGTYDGKVLIYSYDTKELLKTIESHSQATGYSDQSNVMAYGSKTSYSMDGTFSKIYASIMGIAFSPDGKTLAACGGNWIKIFDPVTGKLQTKIDQYGAAFVSVNFSHDGKLLCSGGADFTVRTWDMATGKILQTFTGHQNEVRSVTFSNNDNFLISGSIDTQVKLWDIKKSKELLSYIILAGGNDYIISNPQGYYFATKGASKILSFRIGNKVFPFEQFDLKYNRPDIIFSDLSLFAYGNATDNPNVPLIKSYSAAYKKRLKRLGFTEAQIGSELHMPEISFEKKNIPLITKDPNLEFTIAAKDDKYNLKNINVWVNDVPLYGSSGMSVNTKELTKKVELQLSGERNKITISCMNDKGAESYKENFEITYQGGVQNYKVYYIGIGISNYKDANFNLKYSVKDINDFSAVITSRYPGADITLLTDANATRENILMVKEKLLKTSVNDKVIMSLSGHGLLSKELDFYYATYDMDFHKPERTGLLYDDLEDLLDGIPARNKLLLVDACHSGEVDKERNTAETEEIKAPAKEVNGFTPRGAGTLDEDNSVGLDNSFELMQDVFADLSKGNGAVVISAAGGKEFALESAEWNNGVFTYSVLEGLKNKRADIDNSSKVTVTELKKFVSDNVQLLTGGKQKPTSRRENLENDWVVW